MLDNITRITSIIRVFDDDKRKLNKLIRDKLNSFIL